MTATVLSQGSGRGRFFIAGLGAGQICSWGSLYYSFPLLAEAIGRDLGWSKPALFGAATLGLILSGLAAYPVGAAIDRGHGRRIMAGGSAAAALLLVAWSQVGSLAAFTIVVALVGGLQAAVLYEPAFAVVARRSGPLEARRGITALTLWGGFASTVFVPIAQILIDGLGWRGALLVLAGINLAVAALYALVIDPRCDAAASPGGEHAAQDATVAGRRAVATAMRAPVFWLLAIAFTAYAATFSAFTYHLYPLLLERGLAASEVVLAMMVIGPAQVAGRVAIWAFAARAPVARIGAVTVLAFPASLALLAALPTTVIVAATVALLYGAANGIMTIVRGLAVPEMVTRAAYGAVNGALAAPAQVAKALAPLAAAALWAAAGSYQPVLVAGIVGAFVLVAAFWAAVLVAQPRGAGARAVPPVA